MKQLFLLCDRKNLQIWQKFLDTFLSSVTVTTELNVIEYEILKKNFNKIMVFVDTSFFEESKFLDITKRLNSTHLVIIDVKKEWASYIIRNQNDLSVNDYITRLNSLDDFNYCLTRFEKSAQSEQTDMVVGEYFVVKDRGESTFINLNNITVLEGLGAYTRVHSVNKQYIVSKNLKKILEQLPTCFIRTHRSYAVHIKHINSLSGNQVLLHNGETVKASKTGKKTLISHFSIA